MARILQVCNTDFYLQRFLNPLIHALIDRGHQVECVCEGTGFPRASLPPGLVIHSLTFPKKGSPTEFRHAIAGLRRVLRARKFDCVNSHNRNASIVGRIAAWAERVPLNLYTAHGFYFHDAQTRLIREATIALEGLLARLTDFTLSQSTADAQLMVKRHWIPAHKIEIIGNGINLNRFSPQIDRARAQCALGLAADKFRIAATGRMVQGKGFMDLLNAFTAFSRQQPSAELVMIGGNIDQDISPFATQFKATVRARGLENRVRVTGITEQVELYLAASDVFVLPSYREGLPRALLEAMAMALPVIATDIRGCKEAIQNGESGLLYPPHRVDRLQAAIEYIHRGGQVIERMRQKARERVCTHFDERNYIRHQVEHMERWLLS